jgi:hypothetical protein
MKEMKRLLMSCIPTSATEIAAMKNANTTPIEASKRHLILKFFNIIYSSFNGHGG